jgi:hypothetical protein
MNAIIKRFFRKTMYFVTIVNVSFFCSAVSCYLFKTDFMYYSGMFIVAFLILVNAIRAMVYVFSKMDTL